MVAEGYLFEFERLGYCKAGSFCPEVVLDNPELVKSVHRSYVHGGSDVVLAYTVTHFFYKLQSIHVLEMQKFHSIISNFGQVVFIK